MRRFKHWLHWHAYYWLRYLGYPSSKVSHMLRFLW
jgi:hypothetical protein